MFMRTPQRGRSACWDRPRRKRQMDQARHGPLPERRGRQLVSGMVAPELVRVLGRGPATDIRLAGKHRRGTEHQTQENERNDQRVADQMRRDVRSEWAACATGGILRKFRNRRHGFPWGLDIHRIRAAPKSIARLWPSLQSSRMSSAHTTNNRPDTSKTKRMSRLKICSLTLRNAKMPSTAPAIRAGMLKRRLANTPADRL